MVFVLFLAMAVLPYKGNPQVDIISHGDFQLFDSLHSILTFCLLLLPEPCRQLSTMVHLGTLRSYLEASFRSLILRIQSNIHESCSHFKRVFVCILLEVSTQSV